MTLNCCSIGAELVAFSLVKECDSLRDGTLRLATPLLYPDGSNIDIFCRRDTDLLQETTFLSDLGQTAAYLADLNIFPHKNQKRRRIISDICRTLGVSESDGELQCALTRELSLADGVSRLAQACVRVADLCYTQRFRADSTFKEDFEDFLSGAALRYESDLILKGRFDKDVPVDFSSLGQRASNLIITLSTANTAASHGVATEAFRRWYDLEPQRNRYGFITVFDSSNDAFRPDDLSRLRDFSTVLAYPAEADSLHDILVA